MNQRTPEGDEHGYVGQIIDPDWTPNTEPAEPYQPPVPEGMKSMPKPGIYFGLPEEDYHRVFALSSSGIKKLVASPMEYWAYSPMNPDYEERQSQFLDYGKAAHCLVLEGEDEFARRYAVELDQSDFEDVLVSTDEIKNAIRSFTHLASVSPVQGGKQNLVDQLAALGEKHGKEVELDGTIPTLKFRIREFEEEQPITPYSRVPIDGGEEGATRTAHKPDWIEQLLKLNPDARIWDHMTELHLTANEGKVMITPKQERQVRIAARMIEHHPDAGPMLKGGHAEVSIFWYCPITGVPCKARIDYLKLQAILELKTFSNQQGMPVNKAIERAIANYRYNIGHVFYEQAVNAARQFIRDHGIRAIHDGDDPTTEQAEMRQTFALKWAKITDPPKFMFIFQQSGIAPITRVKGMPRQEVFKATHRLIETLKFKWLEYSQTYGVDPWLDIEPMSEIEDEAIPMWATEMEGFYDQ